MDLKIKDTATHPFHKKLQVKQSDNRNKFRVYISLSGADLPYVDHVVYYLHSTFKNPVIEVKRTLENPDCTLAIWTWGLFVVHAVVFLKNGDSFELQHRLKYDEEIKNPSGGLEVEYV